LFAFSRFSGIVLGVEAGVECPGIEAIAGQQKRGSADEPRPATDTSKPGERLGKKRLRKTSTIRREKE
jgi:hypothetical protein